MDKPTEIKDGLTFIPIPEFDDITMAFGASEDKYFNRRNLPEVPKKYEDMAQELFFKGGSLPKLKPELDKKKAMRAVRALLGSFAPAHEAKITTVGYALWLWSETENPQ